MDDYYSLMGVEPDAPVDDIRAAYRDKKAAIVGTTDADKVNAKKLNKAWNVLSDPYQRGRYDEQRAQAVESGELADADDAEETPSTNGRRSARPTRERGQPRAPLQPTIALPSGVHFAGRRRRIIAMVIDLVVLLVLFVGITQIGAQALAKNQKPEVVENVKTYNKQIDDLNDQLDDAKKAAKGDTTKCGADNVTPVRQKVCDLDKQIKDTTKQRDDEVSKLSGIFFGSIAVTFLLGFLYLALPSMKNGQTLGKRFQHIKVVREDGSPLRAGDVVRRYGIIIIVTFGLFLFLREIAAVLVLIGVTRWLANANQQGLHDRFAKTIVIEDGGAA
jgi:uncharacterized RDD family membrane protein YckC